MISAYHCGNCPIVGCNERTNSTVDFISDIRKQNIIEEFISKHGCLSHPLAQAALREEGAKQEREGVFSFIRDFIATHVPEGGCPFGKMNSEECLDVRDGQCEICIIDHAIESLRWQHGKKD